MIERETGGSTDAADLTKQLLAVRDIKDIRRGRFMDIARFLRERLGLDPEMETGQAVFEAFYAYLLPQFEGIDEPEGEMLFKKIGKLVGQKRRARLRQTFNAVLGLHLAMPQLAESGESTELEEPEEEPEELEEPETAAEAEGTDR